MSAVERPLLRWHGGKFLLADWIIAHFPAHRVYVEPFGGAGSVLLRKARNDLDDEAVNLFRVMRDPEHAARLISGLTLTPFARREFEVSYQPSADPVERARRKAGGDCAGYRHEMSDEDHAVLLDFLCGLKGMVVLSGYPSALYDARLCGTGGRWRKVERRAMADGARERVEALWINPAAQARLTPDLFAEVA